MLGDRKAALLRAAVAEYIRTAQPVGSSALAEKAGLPISSATVRHELAALEGDGYLTQPYTSAGRVPTQAGYRFFVDSVMSAQASELSANAADQIRAFFSHTHGELEDMLQETTTLLSEVTKCAAVVVEPPHNDATIRGVQFVPLSGAMALLVVVLSDGSVEKRAVECAYLDEIQLTEINSALNEHWIDRSLHAIPVPNSPNVRIDHILAACTNSLQKEINTEAERAFIGGAAEVVSNFEVMETAREVLAALEQQYVVVSLLRDVISRGEQVAIGSEHGVEPLSECSVVVAPFSGEGNAVGTLGIVGPTRMDYAHTLAAVAHVSEQLSRRIIEG
jgi:heat-inducible transcriptional repressor